MIEGYGSDGVWNQARADAARGRLKEAEPKKEPTSKKKNGKTKTPTPALMPPVNPFDNAMFTATRAFTPTRTRGSAQQVRHDRMAASPMPLWKQPEAAPVQARGLTNLGNTCFMNASLQAFLRVDGVGQHLRAHVDLCQ